MQKKSSVTKEIEENKAAFALAFVIVFILALVALWLFDLMPNAPAIPPGVGAVATTTLPNTNDPAAPTQAKPELPVQIGIDAIDLAASISNPATTSIEVLDEALLSGAVRYPTSAPLGINGTVLLFGHSSYLPVVHNKAYKAFDGIQNLLRGDTISVFSATKEYRYRVVSVRKANVNDAGASTIALPTDGQHLVLVTCDSFASKSDRFIVTADLKAE